MDLTALFGRAGGMPRANDTSCGAGFAPLTHLFLTVTGTSAEAGDDGEAGRGNRTSGLITPYRAMTIEAAARKNPVISRATGIQRWNRIVRDQFGQLDKLRDMLLAEQIAVN